jgi:hypothetical protein
MNKDFILILEEFEIKIHNKLNMNQTFGGSTITLLMCLQLFGNIVCSHCYGHVHHLLINYVKGKGHSLFVSKYL